MPTPTIATKRRGNPNLGLAQRCGARTRAGCPCRAPAIRSKLRCRMHGGRSTGPRTPEGIARIRAARTIHGRYGAEFRAYVRHVLVRLRRGRVVQDAIRYGAWLPPDLAARRFSAPELKEPPWPTGGLSPAQDRAVLRAEAAALAPWKRAIAAAKQSRRNARAQPHAPEAPPVAAATSRDATAQPHAPEAPPVAAAASRYPAAKPHAPVPPPSHSLRCRLLASTHHSGRRITPAVAACLARASAAPTTPATAAARPPAPPQRPAAPPPGATSAAPARTPASRAAH